ncbi:MAG TPA: hypothetical protein V6D20_21395, partial [Candidatus Obscuribacterales bacterium]
MPRTPRSEEFIPSNQPSGVALESPQTGVQSALIGLGGALSQEGNKRLALEKQYAREKQAQVDRVSTKDFQNKTQELSIQLQLELEQAKDDEARSKIVQDYSARHQSVVDGLQGVSEDQRELMLADVEHFAAVAQSMAMKSSNQALRARDQSVAKRALGLAIAANGEGLDKAITAGLEAGNFHSEDDANKAKQEALNQIDYNRAQATKNIIIQEAQMYEADNDLENIKGMIEANKDGDPASLSELKTMANRVANRRIGSQAQLSKSIENGTISTFDLNAAYERRLIDGKQYKEMSSAIGSRSAEELSTIIKDTKANNAGYRSVAGLLDKELGNYYQGEIKEGDIIDLEVTIGRIQQLNVDPVAKLDLIAKASELNGIKHSKYNPWGF